MNKKELGYFRLKINLAKLEKNSETYRLEKNINIYDNFRLTVMSYLLWQLLKMYCENNSNIPIIIYLEIAFCKPSTLDKEYKIILNVWTLTNRTCSIDFDWLINSWAKLSAIVNIFVNFVNSSNFITERRCAVNEEYFSCFTKISLDYFSWVKTETIKSDTLGTKLK